MYYSAIVIGDHASEQIKKIADHFDIDIKLFAYDSVPGKVLMDNLLEFMDLGAADFPLVLAGYEIVGAGREAWVDLYHHAKANPHVHWEASDSDEGDLF